MALSFVLLAVFFVVEAVAGFATGSLALLSDAGHMLTDVIGVGMALAAVGLASRRQHHDSTADAPSQHTFGLYRLEILAAFVNALLLCAVALWVLVESARRLFQPAEVIDTPMLVVAVLGLLVNLVVFMVLRDGASESLNVQAAYLEVLADTVGSVGVIIAAVLIRFFNWTWADPLIAILIGLWILPRTWRLGRRAVHILLQAAPEGLDVGQFHDRLASIEGVIEVHDVHVWTLTSEMNAASAHIVVADDVDSHAVLDSARDLVNREFDIAHGTFQVEPADHTGCDELNW